MKLLDIYNLLDEISPFEFQEKWDNSGLMVGSFDDEISNVILSIDIDDELINMADDGSLIITHHPIIFSGIKSLDFNSYPSNLLHKMIKKNIKNISMHTNFDKTHLNKFVAKDILKYKIIKEEDFIIYLEVDESFDDFSKKVSKVFDLQHLKVVKTKNFLKRVALTTGSGASLIPKIEADCFLTGDIKYHDAMLAKSLNLSMIDIGHYESEQFFAQILQNYLKNLGLKVIIAQSKNPFTYI